MCFTVNGSTYSKNSKRSSEFDSQLTSSSAHADSSPVVAVFVITKDNQGNLIFLPNSATIKPGEEILLLNNDTKPRTVLNGNGPDDHISGKLFTEAFLEYGASNIQDGKFSFYLQSEPNVKGELTVVSSPVKK